MAEIEQIISEYTGTVPNKNTQTNTEFMTNADTAVQFLTDIPPEINTFSIQANSLKDECNSARSVALASANFAGSWSDLTGAYTVPTSCYYNSKFWMLKSDVTLIQTKTPGVASEWVELTVSTDKGMTLIQSPTVASNDATIEFTSGIDSLFDEYELHLLNVIPANDGVSFLIRTSSDNGVSWDSGASDYMHHYGTTVNANDGEIRLFGDNTVGSDTNENGVSAVIRIIEPADSASYTRMQWLVSYDDTGGAVRGYSGAGKRMEAGTVNGVQFSFSAGNVESGTFKLFGIRKDV